MLIESKIDFKITPVTAELKEVNPLIGSAIMLPLLKKQNAKNYQGFYKVTTNLRSPAFEGFFKRLIFEKPTHSIVINHYDELSIIENKDPIKNNSIFFEGTYESLNIDYDKFDFVFSIAFNENHKNRIIEVADNLNVKIDEIFLIDYNKLLDTQNRYIHGTKWIAATIGASISNHVLIPSCVGFWSTERNNSIITEGAKWLSRYHKRIIIITNPQTLNKKEALSKIEKVNLIPCKCGVCMECVTTYILSSSDINLDFFETDPRRSDENLKKLKSAVKIGVATADIYKDAF